MKRAPYESAEKGEEGTQKVPQPAFYAFIYLVRGEVVQGGVQGLCALVVENVVALAECAALHILAAETHMVVLEQERAKRNRLGSSPVHALPSLAFVCGWMRE